MSRFDDAMREHESQQDRVNRTAAAHDNSLRAAAAPEAAVIVESLRDLARYLTEDHANQYTHVQKTGTLSKFKCPKGFIISVSQKKVDKTLAPIDSMTILTLDGRLCRYTQAAPRYGHKPHLEYVDITSETLPGEGIGLDRGSVRFQNGELQYFGSDMPGVPYFKFLAELGQRMRNPSWHPRLRD